MAQSALASCPHRPRRGRGRGGVGGVEADENAYRYASRFLNSSTTRYGNEYVNCDSILNRSKHHGHPARHLHVANVPE